MSARVEHGRSSVAPSRKARGFLVGLAALASLPAAALAQTPPQMVGPPAPNAPAPTPPPVAPTPPPAPPQPPPVPVVETPATAAAPGPVSVPVAPVPTADETPAPSDHDAVVGHVGLEVRRIDTSPFPLAPSAAAGCPAAATAPCTADVGALSLHYWYTRNVALTGGLALGLGGGRDTTRALDTWKALGPVVGMSLLLGNWRHLAVSASPEASFVWFSTGQENVPSTKLVTVRGVVEGELHFGFVGVPALSLGLDAGVGFRWVSAAGTRVWSVGVEGPGGIASVLSDLFVRYYL